MLSTVFHATSCDFKCSGDNKLILQYLEIITWVLDFLSNAVHNYVSRARESILQQKNDLAMEEKIFFFRLIPISHPEYMKLKLMVMIGQLCSHERKSSTVYIFLKYFFQNIISVFFFIILLILSSKNPTFLKKNLLQILISRYYLLLQQLLVT